MNSTPQSISSIAFLHEYAMKKKLPPPKFIFCNANDDFCCDADFLDVKARGIGRSKKEAKHKAASMIMTCLNIGVSNAATVAVLGEYETQDKQALPLFELVQTTDGHVSLKKCGDSLKQPDIDAHLAEDIVKANQKPNQAEPPKKRSEKQQDQMSSGNDQFGPLADRHNYFAKFNDSLKQAAFTVLAKKYEDVKYQAFDVLKALNLKFTIKKVPSKTNEPNIIIDVDCELDVVFIGTKYNVYKKVIEYFTEMLV